MKNHPIFLIHATLLSTLLLATGCAPLPAAYAPSTAEVPMQQRWWEAYHDAQLNELIDQATSNAPDMQRAQARLRQAEAIRGVTDSAELPQAKGDLSLSKQQQSNNYLFPKTLVPRVGTVMATPLFSLVGSLIFGARTKPRLPPQPTICWHHKLSAHMHN